MSPWNGLKAEMPDNSKVQNYADYFDETWTLISQLLDTV